MTSPLQLESAEALPSPIRERLDEHRDLFAQASSLERILDTRAVKDIAGDLEQFLATQRIHAYHCTKEPEPGFFEARGLRVTDVASHQAEFLGRFASEFTAQELAVLRAAWHDYFVAGGQTRHRDGLIYACLTRRAVLDDGCEPFFKYFGGEAVSKVIAPHPTIAAKLEAIGRPVVVEIAVPGLVLRAGYPMHMAVLSRYHQVICPHACLFDSEARWKQAVPPQDIIKVTPLEEFR